MGREWSTVMIRTARNSSIFTESQAVAGVSILTFILSFFIFGCDSDTDALRRTFAKMAKQLEVDANVAANLYGEKRLIQPLALKFGEANCQHIVIKLEETPFSLRRDPNNLSLPYHATLEGTVTILPCGHRIRYRDEFMAADDKFRWVPLSTGELIVDSIRTLIEFDAKHRDTIRSNIYESQP